MAKIGGYFRGTSFYLMDVGIASEDPLREKNRKPIEEIASFNGYINQGGSNE
ncbi:MAG: hypothetical protein V1840_02870 [Candidatus Omnitrophota bacterium]